jgi:hypothetical protein
MSDEDEGVFVEAEPADVPHELPVFPELGRVVFNADPSAPVPEEDWPESAR